MSSPPQLEQCLINCDLQVFPCWIRFDDAKQKYLKGPAIPKGANWQTVNPNDPRLDWSSGTIGVMVPPGLVVLDLDTQKGVTRADVEAFLGCRLNWDAALIQNTPSGGAHYVFRTHRPIKQRSDWIAGFDTRTAGQGFICSGNLYSPAGNCGPYALTMPHILPELPNCPTIEVVKVERVETTMPTAETRDEDTLIAALHYVDPTTRDTWLKVGMALRNHYHDSPEAGFALFDAWSRGEYWPDGCPPSYEPKSQEQQWASFKAEKGGREVTIGSVYHIAVNGGWTSPRRIDTAAAFRSTVTGLNAELRPFKWGPMDPILFPHIRSNKTGSNIKVLATIENIEALLQHYGIQVFYDVIKKKHSINVPGQSGSPDNADNTALTQCISLAKLNDIPSEQVTSYIFAIADQNLHNPVADWILSTPWDGKDRLSTLYDTLEVKADYPRELRDIMIKRWLISAVAAALEPANFKARGVLTLQGAQSIGKTSWLDSLVPDPLLRTKLVKTDHLLDPSNKDSVIGAVTHWLVELGELDSTFRKDISRLKGFITGSMDKVRRPYDRVEAEYQRRTVFFASVNDDNFLVDDTGNTRFWTVAVESVNYHHSIDMQQVWAQVRTLYESKEQWWLTNDEESQLERLNKRHKVITTVSSLIKDRLDLECSDARLWSKKSATEVLFDIGITTPTNQQSKEAGAALREIIGEPAGNSKGRKTWLVPPLTTSRAFASTM